MSQVATVENAAMERREYLDTKPQDQFAGRGKFDFCHWCGRPDGMKSVHRETLAELSTAIITLTAPWYGEPGNAEYLFYVCPECNRQGTIPARFVQIRMGIVLAWINADDDTNLMAPDYEALAAEPVAATAGQDSWDSAKLEG